MTPQNTSNAYSPEKFQNAEQLWFWFLYSRSVQNGFARNANAATRRACELLDVETLVTKLYLAGDLIWAENRAAALWRGAMETIGAAAKQRGWIE